MWKPTHVIVHHSWSPDTAAMNAHGIRAFHMSYAKDGIILDQWEAEKMIEDGVPGVKKPWSDVGYHYLVEKVAEQYVTIVGRPLWRYGAHCKSGGMNGKALGVCVVGNFDVECPKPKQWEATIKIVGSLAIVFGIPIERVRGHRDYADYKSCPGKLFDMSLFRNDIKDYVLKKY